MLSPPFPAVQRGANFTPNIEAPPIIDSPVTSTVDYLQLHKYKYGAMLRFLLNIMENSSASAQADFFMKYNLTQEDLKAYLNMTQLSIGKSIPATYYCNGYSGYIAEEYKRRLHGYLSLIICLFGTVANVLNVAVLTRKDMACAPINRVLTYLAVADMLVMLEYIPFAYYHNIVFPKSRDFTYIGAVFILFHMNFTNVLHTISICLTITLAIWRYIAIKYTHMNHILCSDRRCRDAILTGYLLPLVLCIPYYFVFHISPVNIVENNQHVTLYKVGLSEAARANNDLLFVVSFWMYSVIFKLLPCSILTVISFYLIKALCKAKQRKQALRIGYRDEASEEAKASLSLVTSSERKRPTKSERRADRTTRMLVAVLLLFLITELPQGIMGLLSVLLGKDFFIGCYNRFGEMMDMLALLNGAINFILYCSMSRQFRTTFGQLFKPKILTKWASVQTTAQVSVQNTYV